MKAHNFNKKMIAYIIIATIFFYILPLFGDSDGYITLLLLGAFPILVGILGYHYGVKHEFNLIFHGIISLLFVPTVFIYYELAILSFWILYDFLLLVSNAIGNHVRRRKLCKQN